MARLGRSFPIRAHVNQFNIYVYGNVTISPNDVALSLTEDNGIVDTGTRYWVGNGGNWNDTAHWAYTSGGSSGASVPGSANNVVFDGNSFSSSGQTVSLNGGDRNCLSMDWTGVINSPTFDFDGWTLSVFGPTLKFVSGMTIQSTGSDGNLYFYCEDTTGQLTTAGHTLPLFQLFLGLGVSVIGLQDNLSVSGQIQSTGNDVSVNTNNHNISCGDFYVDGDVALTLGTSVITASGDVDVDLFGSNNNLLSAGSAQIVMTGLNKYFYMNAFQTIGTVTMQNSVNPFYTTGGTIGTLNLTAGKTYTMDVSSSNDVVNITNSFNAVGSAGNLITLLSATPGSQFTLSKSASIVACDYLHLTDSNATGGAVWFAGANSVDNSNNDGWIFAEADDVLIVSQDTALSTTIDATTITQIHVIATQDVALAITEDNGTVSTSHQITAADLSLGLTTDETAVIQNYTVATQDVALAITIGNDTIEKALIGSDIGIGLTIDTTTIVRYTKPMTTYGTAIKPSTAYSGGGKTNTPYAKVVKPDTAYTRVTKPPIAYGASTKPKTGYI